MVVVDERVPTAEHAIRAPNEPAALDVERTRLQDRAEGPSRATRAIRFLVSGSAWVTLLLAVGAVAAIAFLIAGAFLPGA